MGTGLFSDEIDGPSVGTGHVPPQFLGQNIDARGSLLSGLAHNVHRHSNPYVFSSAFRRSSLGSVVSMYAVRTCRRVSVVSPQQ